MLHKYFLTFLGIFLCYFQVYSQDITSYIPPSPNATALAKFANIPVSLYTGIPQVNIPLYQVQSRTLSVPISLSYHASGIKVQDIASNVGTGWALNAGGVITRVIRGLPDEYDNGYCGKNHIGQKADDPLSQAYADNVKKGIWDGEPDLFYFNFMGRAGRFILSASGEPIIFPQQAIKILPAIGPKANQGWTIITEDGSIYTFGKYNSTQEKTIYITPEGDESPAIITSWYLESMEDANQLDIINFSYETAGDLDYTYYRQIATDVYKFNGANYAFCENEASKTTIIKDINTQIKVKNSLWLKTIYHSRGSIHFKHYFTRADLKNAGMLALIEILDEKGKRIKAYDFDYWFTNLGKASERMFLEQIKEIGGVLDYELLAYSFEYDQEVNLPARNSHQIDHWGYYNSNPYPSKIPAMSFEGKSYAGADKNPDFNRSKANILTQINYVTGGYTKFLYQPHQYFYIDGKDHVAGGVRIRQIIESDGMDASKDIIKNYTYDKFVGSSGQIFRLPTYHHTTYNQKTIIPQNVFCREDYLIRSSHSYADLFDMNGSHIGYSYVTVTSPDKSKITSRFTNFSNFPDQLAEKVNYKNPQENTPIPADEPPFAPSTFVGWKRGLPLEEAIYDAANRIQKKTTYAYTADNKAYPKTTAWVAYVKGNLQTCINVCKDTDQKIPIEYTMARYEILTEAWLLKQKIEESYDQGQTEKKTTQTTQFSYNDYLQLREQIQYVAGDDKRYITEYKYCTDYPYFILNPQNKGIEEGVMALYNKRIFAQPIEVIQHTQTIKNEPLVTLGANLTLFKVEATKVLPYMTLGFKSAAKVLDFNFSKAAFDENAEPNKFHFAFDARYDTLETFDRYDSRGYLLQKTTQNAAKTYYKWSYESYDAPRPTKLLVAETVHQPVVFFADFEGNTDDLQPDQNVDIITEGREGSNGLNLLIDEGYIVQKNYSLLNSELTPDPQGDRYLFSCWIKAKAAGKLTAKFKVDNDNNKVVYLPIPFENTQDQWVYVEKGVEIPGGTSLYFTLDADQHLKLDDILLHLVEVPVKTYIYELPYGIKAITSPDKKVTRYKYDEQGKLKMLLDNENNIREHYEYNYPENE